MMLKHVASFKAISLLALVVVFAAGCSSGPSRDKMTAAQVRVNDTPRMYSLNRSYGESLNLYSRVMDHELRSIHDDLAWIFLLDRNRRLNGVALPAR